MHALREEAKHQYYIDKVSASSNPKELQAVVYQLLHRNTDVSVFPTKIPTENLPDTFADYFCEKIATIGDLIAQGEVLDVSISDNVSHVVSPT